MHSNTRAVLKHFESDGMDPKTNHACDLKMASQIAESVDIMKQIAVLAKHVMKHGICSNDTRVNVSMIHDHAQTFLEIYDKV